MIKTTMLADGGPPLFFSLMKPAWIQIKKHKKSKMRALFKRKKDVGDPNFGVQRIHLFDGYRGWL